MLKLRHETEDWREALISTVCEVEAELGVDRDADSYDDCVNEFCRLTLARLSAAGVDHERAYQQSRGAFVIAQSGDDNELEALDAAMEAARDDVRDFVVRTARVQ